MNSRDVAQSVIAYLKRQGITLSERQKDELRLSIQNSEYTHHIQEQQTICNHPSTRREVIDGVEDECWVVCLSCGKGWREYW